MTIIIKRDSPSYSLILTKQSDIIITMNKIKTILDSLTINIIEWDDLYRAKNIKTVTIYTHNIEKLHKNNLIKIIKTPNLSNFCYYTITLKGLYYLYLRDLMHFYLNYVPK